MYLYVDNTKFVPRGSEENRESSAQINTGPTRVCWNLASSSEEGRDSRVQYFGLRRS